MDNMQLFGFPDFPDESETIEYKESWHADHLKDIAAFANTRGGVMRIGVSDKKIVVGWDGVGRDQERISSHIVESLNIHPTRMEIDEDGVLRIISIFIQKSAAPVSLRGRYYRRVGNSTREIPEAELARFLLERAGQSWDALPSDATLEDIDDSYIEIFKNISKERLPSISPSDSTILILQKLKLLNHENRLNRASVLLFGKNPCLFYPSCHVQIGYFKDEITILDDMNLEGNLFYCINEIMKVLRKYIFVSYEIDNVSRGDSEIEKLQRREVWSIPYEAVRESVLNALVHRDYTRSGSISIKVFADKLIISNPGGLMDGLTVADLLKPHSSLRRNPFVADTFYFSRHIERWGTGTLRMQNSCRNANLPDPVFEVNEHEFRVIFSRNKTNAKSLVGKEEELIELIRNKGFISRKDVVFGLGISDSEATSLLLRMKRRDLIAQEGTKRGAKYRLHE